MPKIAFGGISVENTNFSPLPTTLDDFSVARGEGLLVSGRYPFLGGLKAEFVPTLFAQALPGGETTAEAYAALKGELLERLAAALPVDGVYLDLHGAMYVQGVEDAEGDLARAVRNLVGDQTYIAASMDLHGNISPAYVQTIDMLAAYRTAPHRDTLETRHKACRMLVDALAAGVRPSIALVTVPSLLPGERTRTDMEPGRTVWAKLEAEDGLPGVLDASLFVGFAWVDDARAHAAAVVTGTDRDVAQAAARTIAQRYWDARHDFGYGIRTGSIDECIAAALADPAPCVFISDSGDNLTAGAPGDVPLFLSRLLAHDVPSALLAGIPDAAAAAACHMVGEGAEVSVTLGGKLDPWHGQPLPVRGVVQRLAHTEGGGIEAVIRIGNVDAVVTERRKAFTTAGDFAALELDPRAYKIVVVKLGYLFPELLEIAPAALMALSPGASDLALERLPYRRIARPMFPLDAAMEWSATVAGT